MSEVDYGCFDPGFMREDGFPGEELCVGGDLYFKSSVSGNFKRDLFAFYDLGLTQEERNLLSEIKIAGFNDVVVEGSVLEQGKLFEDILGLFEELEGVFIPESLSCLVLRFVNMVMVDELGAQEFELRIRTRESYESQDDCFYWHLDKSGYEILGQEDVGNEVRFIMALKGKGTLYQPIDKGQRLKFLEIAEESLHYYGHNLTGCSVGDVIMKLFKDDEKVETPHFYGSWHIAGSRGAMHSAPKESGERFLLLLTPKL